MISNGTTNFEDRIDPGRPTDETQSSCKDGRHEEPLGSAHEDAQDSPGKMLIQSVSEILTQSAQSVKALVSGNATAAHSDENGEEKTMLQSMGEKIMQSAQSVKDAVSGRSDDDTAYNEDEKTVVQSVGERIALSAQSVKEAVIGNTDEGEEKTVLQAVGEKVYQSAKTVKDAVKGDVYIVPGDDETAELSILVHTILD